MSTLLVVAEDFQFNQDDFIKFMKTCRALRETVAPPLENDLVSSMIRKFESDDDADVLDEEESKYLVFAFEAFVDYILGE